jgi:hypothetical protein
MWVLAGLGVIALSASAVAQQPGFQGRAGGIRMMPTISPPITNPAILQSLYPTRNYYLPPTYTPPVWTMNPWTGVTVWPGNYTPPAVVSQLPRGQYYNIPGGPSYNPWNNTQYSRFSDSFWVSGAQYQYNPWTGQYTNPLTGGTYNPNTGTLVRPVYSTPAYQWPRAWPY